MLFIFSVLVFQIIANYWAAAAAYDMDSGKERLKKA